MRRVVLALGVGALAACAGAPKRPPSNALAMAQLAEPTNPLLEVLASTPSLRPVLARAEELRLQIVLGLVEPGPDGPQLVQHAFRADAEYFYPASSIKMFAAVAALEWLQRERESTGFDLDIGSKLVYHPLFDGEALADADPTNLEGGMITVGHEIRKLFLVSDNEAFNRLYELVGQDGLAASLAAAGLDRPRIVHRLAELRSADQNRRYPQIDLSGPDFRLVLRPRTSEPLPPGEAVPGILLGQAYWRGDRLIEEPMDFSDKNFFPLVDLQRGLCMVVTPAVDCGGRGFELRDEDRDFLRRAMSEYPARSDNPRYDEATYPDSWGKFLLPGLVRVIPQQQLEIANKVGTAYGFTVENAMVGNRSNGRMVFVTATLYTNANQTLNDDTYEYATVARPFLADLGEAIARRFLLEQGASP